jgi:hypothetical protein
MLVRGTVRGLRVEVELHHEASGLTTAEEFSIDAVVGGWYYYWPGTHFDPPESDSEINLDMSHRELEAAVGRAAMREGFGLCTVVTHPKGIASQLHELAEEAVLDNIDDYLVDPE